MGFVDQNIASWNQMVSWLRVLHSLRGVAYIARGLLTPCASERRMMGAP